MKTNRKYVRIATDAVLILLLPLLMGYMLVGELYHEIIGTIMMIAFIAHHALNFGSIKAIFKGKYNARRIVNTVINALLFVIMILLPISGILMSKHLYTFLNISGLGSISRITHMLCAYWGFVLMCLHAGMHAGGMLVKIRKNRIAYIILLVLCAIISIYGIYAFYSRNIYEYMFLKTQFVFFDTDGKLLFFIDYISIMVLFVSLGAVVDRILKGKIRR